MKAFLTAYWRHLINLTYQVEPACLAAHVPSGLELDLWQGRAHVSLVAFEFLQTKVKGVKIPLHADFPEINLRYYVRWREKRGVMFLREFVPKQCLALVANKFYHEPYQALAMSCQTRDLCERMHIQYRVRQREENFTISLVAETASFVPAITSVEHHFKEHELGFGKDKAGNTLYYRVEHPIWEIHPIQECRLHLDFGKLYGEHWAFLNAQQPVCALVAKGSWVNVFPPQKL